MTDTLKPAVLGVLKLPPFYQRSLEEAFLLHDRLHQTDSEAFRKVAPTIRAITGGGGSSVPRSLIEQLPALEMISIMGVGYDKVDVQAANERGIPVTHTPGVLDDEVADLAIGLLLCVARKIPQGDRYVREGKWAAQGHYPLTRKMSGARLGIVGLGRIGGAIARRAEAFGMKISYTTRTKRAGCSYTHFADVRDLAANVDFLVVTTPGGEATRKMISAEVLKALGPRGYLVNVARGSVVDEQALLQALQEGAIAGAGLDVFENEPHVPEGFFALDNVVLTPHMASGTMETLQAMANLAFDNLNAHFAGRPLLTPVPESSRRTG